MRSSAISLALVGTVLTSLAVAPAANAQFSSVAGQAPQRFSPAVVAGFSKKIEDDLANRGARVAIVFRSGDKRSALPKGISYTHGAFWVYRTIATADGRLLHGYAVYNLFAGDGKAWPKLESRLQQDWPFDFTLGTAVDDVAIIVPTPEMQRRILTLIDSPAYEALHNPRYSLISNPLASEYQNCNGFMLDVVAAAAWDTTSKDQIRANLKAHFKPSPIKVDLIKRMLAPLADERIKLDDQHGVIETATFESMAAFMHDNHLSDAEYVLKLSQ